MNKIKTKVVDKNLPFLRLYFYSVLALEMVNNYQIKYRSNETLGISNFTSIVSAVFLCW